MKLQHFKNNTLAFKKDLTNKIGLGLSIAIFVLAILGFVAVFTNTHRAEIFISIEPRLFGYLHFAFGLIAIAISGINIVEFSLINKKKLNKIHNGLHACNLALAVSMLFNFLFAITYLIPLAATTKYNPEYLFAGSNMIFNLGLPILSAILYIFCFKGYSLKNKGLSLVGAIPVFIYFVIYLALSLANLNKGTTTQGDAYMFGRNQGYLVIIASVLSIVIACAISIGTGKLNKISKLNRGMFIAVINIAVVLLILASAAGMFYYNIVYDSVQEGLGPVQSAFMRFLYFTHLSVGGLGVSSVIYSIYAIKVYKGLAKAIPIGAQVVRLAGIAAVSITILMQFVVSGAYMINGKSGGNGQECLTAAYIKCFQKYLMIEHFIVPILAVTSFILLEHTQLRGKHILHAASPLAIYVLIYAIVLYCHIGQPLRKGTPGHEKYVTPWDIYDITETAGPTGKYGYGLVPFITYACMLFLNGLFGLINRKVHIGLPKKGPALAELKKDGANGKARK